MGKTTGFLEYSRELAPRRPVTQRVNDWFEIYLDLPEETLKKQGARCMDCGVPFCQTGCPVNNLIPDWNDLVYRGRWKDAVRQLHATNNFPEFTGRICPAPCEASCVLGINQPAVTIKQTRKTSLNGDSWKAYPARTAEASHREKVAIVGSGSAGLAAAHNYAALGMRLWCTKKQTASADCCATEFRSSNWRSTSSSLSGADVGGRREVCYRSRSWERRFGGESAPRLRRDRACGRSRAPRDLKIPGRDLKGIHFAMEICRSRISAASGTRSSLKPRSWPPASEWSLSEAAIRAPTAWEPATGRSRFGAPVRDHAQAAR